MGMFALLNGTYNVLDYSRFWITAVLLDRSNVGVILARIIHLNGATLRQSFSHSMCVWTPKLQESCRHPARVSGCPPRPYGRDRRHTLRPRHA